jgi:phosphatidate cytidylyltransferase
MWGEMAGIAVRTRLPGGLAARVITALLTAPLVIASTVAGGSWFVTLVLIVAGLSAWEISTLQRKANIPVSPWITLTASWAFPLAAALHETLVGTALLGLTIVGGLLSLSRSMPAGSSAGAAEHEYAGDASLALAGWGFSIATGLYVGALLAPSITLRQRPDGVWWLALILGATWACDTAAYFVGRQWGRHKIAPSVSPQKSVEGTIAGVAAAVVACAMGGVLMGALGPRFVGLGVVIASGAVLGDLAESVLKRHLGAKDSGWMMPGHGGLLDRIDSLLLASFVAYFYITVTDRMTL